MKKLKRLAPAAILFSLLWIAVEGARPLAAQDDSAGKTHRSRFSLKLTGGLSFPDTGDINGMIRSYEDATAQITADGQSAVLDWKRIKSVYEGTVELQFALTDRVSLGLETGFMRKRFPGTWNIATSYPDVVDGDAVTDETSSTDRWFNDSFNVAPVVLNCYYFLHRGKFDYYVKGGIGCYFGRYELDRRSVTESTEMTDYYEDGTYEDTYEYNTAGLSVDHGLAHAVTVGLQAGAGLEWKLSDKIALGFEGLFRTVDLKNWNGYVDNLYTSSYEQGYLSEGLQSHSDTTRNIAEYSLRCYYGPQSLSSDRYVTVKKVDMYYPVAGKAASLRLDGLSFRIGLKIGL